MSARLRWGVLGAARIAVRRVLPALLRSERSAVVAIASRDRDRATDTAQQFQIPKVHPSYDALLADPEVDAVYNPLPNSLHRPWTIRSAEAGKHVLCEKPLALNAREAEQMVEVCRRRGVLLQEAFMYRFHPQTERLQELVGSEIGTPWLVRSAFTFLVATDEDIRLNPELGGGGLMDVGCYCVNICRLLFGEPHTAFAASSIEGGVDVRLAGLLRFGGDRVAEFDCGVRAPFRQFCEVVGASGSIVVERPFQPEERPTTVLIRRGDQERRVEIPGTNQYVRMIDHFVDCVLSQRPPRYPPEDAVANMRVIDALRESAKSSQTVSL